MSEITLDQHLQALLDKDPFSTTFPIVIFDKDLAYIPFEDVSNAEMIRGYFSLPHKNIVNHVDIGYDEASCFLQLPFKLVQKDLFDFVEYFRIERLASDFRNS
jgi:hypothetical protein